MGFSDLFSKRKQQQHHHQQQQLQQQSQQQQHQLDGNPNNLPPQYRKGSHSSTSSSAASGSAAGILLSGHHHHHPSTSRSPSTASQSDPLYSYLPDKQRYPNSNQLTKQLVRTGSIKWDCCRCGSLGNQFSVRRGDLDPDNLLQPFFHWGDSFCNNCSHNFCSACIEGHTC